MIPSNYPIEGLGDLLRRDGNQKKKMNARVRWLKDRWGASLAWFYLGNFYQSSLTLADDTRYVIPSHSYWNASVDYRLRHRGIHHAHTFRHQQPDQRAGAAGRSGTSVISRTRIVTTAGLTTSMLELPSSQSIDQSGSSISHWNNDYAKQDQDSSRSESGSARRLPSLMLAIGPQSTLSDEAWRTGGPGSVDGRVVGDRGDAGGRHCLHSPDFLCPPGHHHAEREAAAPYANPIIYLFLGGFLIALAMQRWDLHKRIALALLSGFRHQQPVAGGWFHGNRGAAVDVDDQHLHHHDAAPDRDFGDRRDRRNGQGN